MRLKPGSAIHARPEPLNGYGINARNQQQLFTTWIDARHQAPKDGQKVLGYYQHDDGDPLGFRYGDMTIVGPVIWTHHQQYIDDGKIRPLVYWQAIDDLPGVGDVAN